MVTCHLKKNNYGVFKTEIDILYDMQTNIKWKRRLMEHEMSVHHNGNYHCCATWDAPSLLASNLSMFIRNLFTFGVFVAFEFYESRVVIYSPYDSSLCVSKVSTCVFGCWSDSENGGNAQRSIFASLERGVRSNGHFVAQAINLST